MSEFVKRANQEVEFTPENLRELKRCAQDPIYFINNYCYIQNQELGEVKFKLRGYQERVINALHQNQFVVLMQSRQSGKCFFGATLINTCTKPAGIKKLLLRIFFPAQHRHMFND